MHLIVNKSATTAIVVLKFSFFIQVTGQCGFAICMVLNVTQKGRYIRLPLLLPSEMLKYTLIP